jgi:hypothetical protein
MTNRYEWAYLLVMCLACVYGHICQVNSKSHTLVYDPFLVRPSRQNDMCIGIPCMHRYSTLEQGLSPATCLCLLLVYALCPCVSYQTNRGVNRSHPWSCGMTHAPASLQLPYLHVGTGGRAPSCHRARASYQNAANKHYSPNADFNTSLTEKVKLGENQK